MMHNKELATLVTDAFAEAGCIPTMPRDHVIPRARVTINTPRRQYVFQHQDGTVETFTAIAEYRDGEVTLTDVQDHRWVMPATGPRVHWVDQIHDAVWEGEDA